jgi:uncharacterized protein (TIGR02147 family)
MAHGLFETTDYRRFLVDALRARGQRQQDLAAAVGRVPSAISQVLSRVRTLDPTLVEPIAAFLDLDAEQTAYLAALVDLDSRSPRAQRQAWATIQATQQHRAQEGLSAGVAAALRQWYFPIVVEMASCEGFRVDAAWIAGSVDPPITVQEAEEALRTALALGVLLPNSEGGLSAATEFKWTPSDLPREEEYRRVVEAHRAAIGLAAESISRHRPTERHVSRVVFRTTEERFERVRARLRELERELVLLAAEPDLPATRVYQLTVQLVPVSLFTDSTADHSTFATSHGPLPPIEPEITE